MGYDKKAIIKNYKKEISELIIKIENYLIEKEENKCIIEENKLINIQKDEKISEFLDQNKAMGINLVNLKNNFNNNLMEIRNKDIKIKGVIKENDNYQIEIKEIKNKLQD